MKEFEKINVTPKTAEEIRFTAKVLNKTISGFLEELFDNLIQLSGNFKNGANVTYIYEYNDLKIRFSGSQIVQSGTLQMPSNASDREIDAKIKQEFDKGR